LTDASRHLRLPFEVAPESLDARIDARDRAARARAVDPRFDVALEASAGTGKTRVLVQRYINLLRAGVDPSNILAMTFTRKAAAEMRERILATLREAADRGEIPAARWRVLRDRTGEIAISTIDAFCLSLLREFPLEADLDPGFAMADETEVPRLIDESLDRALRVCRSAARDDEDVALVFAQIGERRIRAGLAALLNRRLVAPSVLARYLARAPRGFTLGAAAERAARGLLDLYGQMRGGLDRFLDTGPDDPAFRILARRLRALESAADAGRRPDAAAVYAAFVRTREYFLTQDGAPRSRPVARKPQFFTPHDWEAHKDLVVAHAPAVESAFAAYRRELNLLVSRGVRRMFAIAEADYTRTLESHAVLDFPDLLLRALALLRQMEEFAQSRYRLESRYHHVLLDEFQDTSRAQWELVSLLVKSWGEGAGLAHSGPLEPSIFVVGDQKQSIYGFRDADVGVLRDASRYLETLRARGDVRRTISRSFRSVPPLLAFVNDLCGDMDKAPARRDAFQFTEDDRFPIDEAAPGGDALGMLVADTPEDCAEATAGEIARLLADGTAVRDRDTGVRRPLRPADVGILFRTRESHREFEAALERRGIRAYVYKGLGFFDADEIKDVLALLWYLADPVSDRRAAAFLRSRFVRLSDEGLRQLAPHLADALIRAEPPGAAALLSPDDRAALDLAREGASRWQDLVDRMPPAELLDRILIESAYAFELRGVRCDQARENVKKMRALVRRIQNRGYATLGRIAEHIDRLAVGDEANAVIDAGDAVQLMTVHASKGLEFPVAFVVNLAKGTGARRPPIRVTALSDDESIPVSVGDFLSDADEDAAAREREETKRLLYVALTRARDRLYLGTVLKEGSLQPGRGSLAEVLPPSFAACFARAMAADHVDWTAGSGAAHVFRVCAAAPDRPDGAPAPDFRAETIEARDFSPIPPDSPRKSASDLAYGETPSPAAPALDSERLVGTLVHRLIERAGLTGAIDDRQVNDTVDDLIRLDAPGAAAIDRHEVAARAAAAYRSIREHPALPDLSDACSILYEVPFTLGLDGALVRGTIDCLVTRPHGPVTVLEFKTGAPRPEDATQAALYRKAAEALFPGTEVDVRVLYAAESEACARLRKSSSPPGPRLQHNEGAVTRNLSSTSEV
jgi:ATP-dependent helicase/nuclease subunit A